MNHQSYRALIAYSGSPYYGFKRTNAGPTIQGELERCLQQLLGHPLTVEGASLTDRGVHAEGQVIQFSSTQSVSCRKLLGGLRALLPKSIAPIEVSATNQSFHPSLDATHKEYHYSICNLPSQLPFNENFSWHVPLALDLRAMQQAIPLLIGKRDFSSFANERYEDPSRHLMRVTLRPLEGNRLRIELVGDRFLYKMVRNLVGTLTWVGLGKIQSSSIPEILAAQDRRCAGPTAPAHGLLLKRVYY